MDGERRAIGCWSRSFFLAEQNYSAPERECLAVVWALRTLRPNFLYEELIVQTDRAAVRWLLTIQEPYGRLIRWRLHLSKSNLQVMCRKDPCNVHADALSLLTTLAETTADDWDAIPSFFLSHQNSAHTEIHHEGSLFTPLELHYKLACKNTQLQRDDTLCDAKCLIDMSQDDLFPVSSDPTPAESHVRTQLG